MAFFPLSQAMLFEGILAASAFPNLPGPRFTLMKV
jgi:hypothetical protein